MQIEIIIVAIITGVFMLANTALSKKDKTKKKHVPTIDKSLYYMELDKISFDIRNTLKAQGVYIAYFHNGGNFINGIPMDKYTVVGEDYTARLTSYKSQYKDRLVNNFPYLFHNLIANNRHYINCVLKDESHDKSYKDDLLNRNINSAYTFLIKDPIKKTPLGFISIEYQESDCFDTTKEGIIWKYQNDIANILNMNIPSKH